MKTEFKTFKIAAEAIYPTLAHDGVNYWTAEMNAFCFEGFQAGIDAIANAMANDGEYAINLDAGNFLGEHDEDTTTVKFIQTLSFRRLNDASRLLHADLLLDDAKIALSGNAAALQYLHQEFQGFNRQTYSIPFMCEEWGGGPPSAPRLSNVPYLPGAIALPFFIVRSCTRIPGVDAVELPLESWIHIR